METLWQDLRYGMKMLVKSPVFTIAAVLTLALGIGANTAIFSLTDQILLRRLPVPNPEKLVVFRSPGPNRGSITSDSDSAESFSYLLYKDLRDRSTVFDGVLARFAIPLSIAGGGQTERANGELVSGNYFETLRVPSAMGRVFTQDDDRVPGAHPVIVLSHGYWARRFGGDPGVLNDTLVVNGQTMTIVGVARAGFNGVQVGQMPDIFIPMAMKAQMTPNWDGLNNRRDSWLAIMGRLKPEVTPQQAEEALRIIYRPILEEELKSIRGWSPDVQERFLDKRIILDPGARGRPILQRDAEEPLAVLMIMVGLVLLIACANVANLLIARGAARQREIAVRMALGAGRGRLVRQLLVESFILALLGGVAGLGVGYVTIKALYGAVPSSIGASGLSSDLNGRLLAFNFGLAILASLMFGLAPAARTTRLNLESTLREQGSSVSSSLSQVRFRKILVASQIVLTTVLLVCAGLFARSLGNLMRMDMGLRSDHLMTFSIAPELNGYSPERSARLFDDLQQGLASLPGVASVGAARIALFTGSNAASNITAEGYRAGEGEDMTVGQNWVGPDYFATMGIPLIAGREFMRSDSSTSAPVAIINESMARRFYADRSPVGSRFGFGSGDAVRLNIEIVGVVKDSRHSGAREERGPFVYIPYSQRSDTGRMTFYVRTRQEPSSLASAVRSEVSQRDSNLPVFNLKTFDQQLDESMFADRFLTILSSSFGLVAAALASIGLYGVMAYTVARRTREIGIRVALGATRRRVSGLILREVVVLAAAGLVVGLPGAFAIGRFAESLLFGVSASDLPVFAASTVLLALVALFGGYLPARRAGRIDPITALRHE